MVKNKKTKFKQTEIGMIPEDWVVKKITDIGKVITGKTPPTKEEKYWGRGHPFVTPSDISNFDVRYNYNVERQITNKWLEVGKKYFLPKDTVCFVCIGSTIGKMCLLKEPSFTNQQINSIIPNEETDSLFLFYLLRHKQNNIKNKYAGGGAAKDIIKKTTFENIELTIPKSKEEQTSIASILSSLDSKIELNQQMNKTLEAIGKAIFKHWFIDFEFPNEEGKSYKSSGGEMAYSEELGKEIPQKWRVQTLGELGDLKNGINYSRNENGNTAFNIINVRDLVSNNFVLESTLDKINIDYEKARNYLLTEGDVVIARSASPGETIFIVNKIENLIYSGFSIRFRTKNPASRIYLFNNFQKLKDNLSNLSDGTTLKNINQETLKKVQIVIPEEEVLIKYNLVLENLYPKIVLLLRENKSLIEILDSLLPKLMSGKIRVPVEVR